MIKPYFLVVNRFSGYLVLALLAFVVLLTALVYSTGLSGPFVFDDAINIVNNQNLRIDELNWSSLYRAATSIPNGMFGRPLSMLSFAADFYRDSDVVSPFPIPNTFKKTNLLIHLANGMVLFALTRLLVKSISDLQTTLYPSTYCNWLALVVTTAWLLHPFNLTGVLYVVQRMTSLSALFIMLGMVFYLLGRRRLAACQTHARITMVAAVGLFTPLAFLCKEIGILLPVYIMLIESICFSKAKLNRKSKHFLQAFSLLFFWLPVAVGAVFFLTHSGDFLNSYVRRDFTLPERLMTESRVVWFYLYQTVLPNIALMGIFHDDFLVSHRLFDSVGLTTALLGLIVLVVIIFATRKVKPLISFGLAFFLIGHSLESTIIPLELVHEHRNYLPGFGILLILFHVLLDPTMAQGARVWRRLAAVILLALFVVITQSRVADWSSPQKLWSAETAHHPDSVRAQLAMANFYANALTLNPIERENNYAQAMEAFERALQLNNYNSIALFGILKMGKTFERPVDPHYAEDLKHGLQYGSIAPDTNDRMIDLALSVGQPHCPVTATQFEEILQAALANTKLQGREKALIYSAQSFYLANIKHNLMGAHESILQAIALDGDIEHQMWLANILIAMRDVQSAKRQIELLRQIDSHHAREKDIAKLELLSTAEPQ